MANNNNNNNNLLVVAGVALLAQLAQPAAALGPSLVDWSKVPRDADGGILWPRDDGCPHGKEDDAGLCYVPCKEGYVGVGPVCWKGCLDGWTDAGALCTDWRVGSGTHLETRAKHSYGRGAGTVNPRWAAIFGAAMGRRALSSAAGADGASKREAAAAAAAAKPARRALRGAGGARPVAKGGPGSMAWGELRRGAYVRYYQDFAAIDADGSTVEGILAYDPTQNFDRRTGMFHGLLAYVSDGRIDAVEFDPQVFRSAGEGKGSDRKFFVVTDKRERDLADSIAEQQDELEMLQSQKAPALLMQAQDAWSR